MSRTNLLVAITAAAVLAACFGSVEAQERKRTPALRAQVYDQLSMAQELADGGDVAAGLRALGEVERKADSMNSYERAMMWNFYGYMYYEQDDVDNAMRYFAKVVDESPIPESLELNTLFSLAQLALTQERYAEVLEYLDRWQQVSPDSDVSKAQVLKAQALYQQGNYKAALEPITAAITAREAKGGYADENWYILVRAIQFELGNTQAVAKVLETMVRAFNKPEYWLQLAGVYADLGEDKKQLAMLETAYQQGFLTDGKDLMNLAQAYFFNDVPFKAGQVIEKGLADGNIEADLRNLKMLSQSWIAARETDKAVLALAQAAELSDDGQLDAQRAQVLLNAERNQDAIAAAETALQKGGLDAPGTMHLVIGMAELNLLNYNDALAAFATAKKFDDVRKMAVQWERFASSEKQQAELLEQLDS